LALVTVRVPERLKKEMRKLKSVNWSALLREAIESRIELEHRTLTRDWEKVREGSRRADSVYMEMARRYGQIEFNSAETIRYWREMRSRGMSQTPQ
jgi:hypothetical protein